MKKTKLIPGSRIAPNLILRSIDWSTRQVVIEAQPPKNGHWERSFYLRADLDCTPELAPCDLDSRYAAQILAALAEYASQRLTGQHKISKRAAHRLAAQALDAGRCAENGGGQ